MARPIRLHPRAFRTLADAGLDGEPTETFKTDARSSVWQVEVPVAPTIIKRFEHSPWRQWLALFIGAHPAQVELRWNRRLHRRGVPVVPIIDAGLERRGRGCRAWLATPRMGLSMGHLLLDPVARAERGEQLVDQAADLALMLLQEKLWSRDFKPSNLVIDDAGVMRLIDVGCMRRRPTPAKLNRMLAVMDRRMRTCSADDALCARFANAVRKGAAALIAQR